jgi:hypothetical protein
MGQFKEWIVYTGKETYKDFDNKEAAIKYAMKNDREVWEDTVTTGGMVIDSVQVWPDTGRHATSVK